MIFVWSITQQETRDLRARIKLNDHVNRVCLFMTSLQEEINEAMCKWYCLARDSMVPINGPTLREEASTIAARLGKYPDFKASSGWLECWKHQKQRVAEGESGQVQTEAVDRGWRG